MHFDDSDTQFHLTEDRLLARTEVAEHFGIPTRFLEIAATRGDGPPMYKIGGRMVRYRVGDIRAWIARRKVQSTSDIARV